MNGEYGSGEIWGTCIVNIKLSNGTEIEDAKIEITNDDLVQWDVVGDYFELENAIEIKLGLSENW